MTVDLIITTYKPNESLVDMVDAWTSQSVPVNRIIICNKEEKYFDRLLFNGRFMDNHKNVEVYHVSAREYDCGKSRNLAARHSEADLILFVSQGVMPADPGVIADLLEPFSKDPKVAAAYARPVPLDTNGAGEQYIYAHYFPSESSVRSVNDLSVMGWKACHIPDQCMMFRRTAFEFCGGFDNHIICCAGTVFGHRLLKAGYKIACAGDAMVRLDTELSLPDERASYFDLAVLAAMHPDIFDMREVRAEGRRIFKGAYHEMLQFGRFAAYRYNRLLKARSRGFRKGRIYRRLPIKAAAASSYNREFWRAEELLRARGAVNSHEGYGRSESELDMLHGNTIKTHNWDKENPSDQ